LTETRTAPVKIHIKGTVEGHLIAKLIDVAETSYGYGSVKLSADFDDVDPQGQPVVVVAINTEEVKE